MSRPKLPLTPEQARNTRAHRFTSLVDKLRERNTTFGLRSQRVFLVWSRFDGEERGEGNESILARVEILPTPRVSDLSSITRRPYAPGVFPEGSIRVDQISAGKYTEDMLKGLDIPTFDEFGCCTACRRVRALPSTPVNAKGPGGVERTTQEQTDFWWEVVEDGRGDSPEQPTRYRVFGGPSRQEGAFQWVINLELADEATDRSGRPQIGVNTAEQTAESNQLVDGEGAL